MTARIDPSPCVTDLSPIITHLRPSNGSTGNAEAVNIYQTLMVHVWLFVAELVAQTMGPQCAKGEFSGEARQGQPPFSRELRGGIKFSVIPMQAKEDPRWTWFKIRVIGDDQRVFVFNLSDTNWLLATDFWSAFIGGAYSDQEAALQYLLRYWVLPTAFEDKERLRRTADAIHDAKTKGEIEERLKALRAIPLGLIRFEITDYGLGAGQSPMSVDWVKFAVNLTFPPEFSRPGPLFVTKAECPAIPDEVVENIRSTNRHKYVLRLH